MSDLWRTLKERSSNRHAISRQGLADSIWFHLSVSQTKGASGGFLVDGGIAPVALAIDAIVPQGRPSGDGCEEVWFDRLCEDFLEPMLIQEEFSEEMGKVGCDQGGIVKPSMVCLRPVPAA
jgi:hypothetical protein|tara:strand:+ start:1484 stop:1846 length:363 start_codon:yes stop_codon:yes gene_type:complete